MSSLNWRLSSACCSAPRRAAESRIAWIVVVTAIPLLGIVVYLLFGETSIGRKRVARAREVIAQLPDPAHQSQPAAGLSERCTHLFHLGETINGFVPVAGNRATLTRDSNGAIEQLVADMDAANKHIHLSFYIWLSDNNGLKIVAALQRAAARGVTCRAMADGLGSRPMIRSEHWRAMRDSGVQLGVALPIGNPIVRLFDGRIDLRNHRKIVVIDGQISYCGSQNCADPEFRVKPKFAPWVDILLRFEGPVVAQNQYVFASDWMTYVDDDISELVTIPVNAFDGGFPAQVIATGPTVRDSAMPETFETLMYSARSRLVITTPYYVPNGSMQAALCAAANRGVDTTIIFPARNDSMVVAAASRSYYQDLLETGVNIQEYVGGLLHSKTMTVDDDITLVGSANMDRRSFDLNYENNILLQDRAITAKVRARQQQYLDSSETVTLAEVEQWPMTRRLWNNAVAMLGPLL